MKYILSIFLTICSLCFAADNTPQTHFKLYCLYTPQYQTLYEHYFLPSIKDDFEVVLREHPQECPSGVFHSEGWDKTMLHKLEMLQEAIVEHWNDQIFFYSDIDIIFLKPILESALACLGDNDLAIQQGWPYHEACAGFFVMRGNERTLKFITDTIQLFQEKGYKGDQPALRAVLKNLSQEELAWKFLPSEQFPNGRRVLKYNVKGLYSAGDAITLDDSIVLFHGNCCLGLDTKYYFLNHVQQEYAKKQALEVVKN